MVEPATTDGLLASPAREEELIPSQSISREVIYALASGVQSAGNGHQLALTRLSASDRCLAGSLVDAFSCLPHLTSLDLSGNRLHSLSGLEALPALSTLVCKSNRLMAVLDFPQPVGGSQLRHVDLSHNAITGAVSMPGDDCGRARGLDAHH